MDGGGPANGEGAADDGQTVAAEDGQGAAAEGLDLGTRADPAMASLGDGGAAEGSGQRAAMGAEGPGQRAALTAGWAGGSDQGGAWDEGSPAGGAGGSRQGTAGSASAAAVQGASRLASTTWACPDGEPPKKRRKTTKLIESSIVPRVDEAPTAAMYFPPSQSLEITTKKKGKHSQI